jgi:hypothetical protein
MAAFQPGQLCGKCQRPIFATQPKDLGHTDDGAGYLGLEHRRCNRAHGGAMGAAVVNAQRAGRRTSRNW